MRYDWHWAAASCCFSCCMSALSDSSSAIHSCSVGQGRQCGCSSSSSSDAATISAQLLELFEAEWLSPALWVCSFFPFQLWSLPLDVAVAVFYCAGCLRETPVYKELPRKWQAVDGRPVSPPLHPHALHLWRRRLDHISTECEQMVESHFKSSIVEEGDYLSLFLSNDKCSNALMAYCSYIQSTNNWKTSLRGNTAIMGVSAVSSIRRRLETAWVGFSANFTVE